jgi:succinyl-diaminopimelate desuccinylase
MTTQALELTQTLLGFDTINPPGAEEACAHHLGKLLQDAGFSCSYHRFGPGRASLIARSGRGGRTPLCLTGHLDTVPLGDAPWQDDPFQGVVRDGRLYGRGSTDMKSGLAAFTVAATEMARHEPDLVLVFTAGEETGAEGAAELARAPAELGQAGAILVGEPTSNAPLLGHKGALWLKAHARGVTAHGSMPERGVNAVYKAGHMLTKLENFELDVPTHEVLGRATLNVGTIQGGLNLNSIPDHCELTVDIRTVPGSAHPQLRGRLREALAPDLDDLNVLVDLEHVWTDPSDEWVRSVYSIMEEISGTRPEPGGASYFTDASVLKATYGGVPTVILGPGEPSMAHQTDEYCEVARIDQAVEAYKRIIDHWQTT